MFDTLYKRLAKLVKGEGTKRKAESAQRLRHCEPARAWQSISENSKIVIEEITGLLRFARNNEKLRKKFAFTLAEVLITIAIVGTVAAMTLPLINKQCQKVILQNQIKKAYAEVRLGIKLSESDNGPMASWPTGVDMVMEDYWQTYLKPYFKGAVLCQTINTCGYDKNKEKYNDSVFTTKWLGGYWKVFSNDTRILFQLKDNTTIFIIKNTDSNGVPIYLDDYFWIDVNGPKKPNTLNKDVFKVRRNTNDGITPMETLLQIQKNGWKLPQSFSL